MAPRKKKGTISISSSRIRSKAKSTSPGKVRRLSQKILNWIIRKSPSATKKITKLSSYWMELRLRTKQS